MKKFISLMLATVVLGACTNKKHSTDYRTIAFQQNELIIAYEEKVEEHATVIQTAFPAYKSDYSDIDSLSCILDSLYIN
jgi:hypothetical protein